MRVSIAKRVLVVYALHAIKLVMGMTLLLAMADIFILQVQVNV